MMLTINEHWYSLALFAYVLSELFFAAVRWFHMCPPYSQAPNYYYPERKDSTWMHLSAVILLPQAIDPNMANSWTYVKAYLLIFPTFYCGYLTYKFIGTIKHWNNWKAHTFILAVPFSLTILALFLANIKPACNISPSIEKALLILVYVEGVISVLYCLRAIFRIRRWLLKINEDYSNDDDFPVNYAKRVQIIPFLQVITIWPAVLIGGDIVMSLLLLELSVVNVISLLLVLSPQRRRALEETWKREESTDELEEADGIAPLPQEQEQDITNVILATIKKIVEDEQGYLNPHLSLQDVADQCPYGRTYVSRVFKNELGGFFNYVNMLRLNHADAYKEKHPMATIDEIATASGFTSRQSLYRVRQRKHKQ